MGIEQRSDAGTPPVPGAGPAGAATMRAAVQHRYGPPSVLELSEVGPPLPGRGDVLVQVGAASVHPGDCFIMTGEPYLVRLAFGLRRPRHGIPGRDLAGMVAAVGKDVTALRPGDEVFGWSTTGTLAEYACVPADNTRTDFTRTENRYDVILDNVQAQPLAATPSTKQPTPCATSRPATPEGRSSSPSDGRPDENDPPCVCTPRPAATPADGPLLSKEGRLMKIRTDTAILFDNPPIPVQVKLAAAWTSFMFLYVYVDVLNFYKPGVVDSILNGLMWRFAVSPTLLTIALVSVSIPALMVMLSMTLPARVNRAANLVVASILIPYSMFNAAGTTWEWAGFYGISIGLELLLLAFVLRSAWTWPRISAIPAGPATTGLRQNLGQQASM